MIDKKSILIVALIIVVNFMTVGYALMAAELEQKSTNVVENEKPRWNVEIGEINNIEISGHAESISSEVENSLTAKFSTKLEEKEAYLIYTVKVTNMGTMDAFLKNISYSETEDVAILIEDIKVNDILKAGETTVFKITVKNNSEALEKDGIVNDFFISLDYKSE